MSDIEDASAHAADACIVLMRRSHRRMAAMRHGTGVATAIIASRTVH
ncbi:MAG TPA: hypothetical protein VMR06_01700 [Dokdonella sp.]|nr:hypothetical protein [Dokdonella sp.]HUD40690.1 hypothetical protein [Dokdonella sp.]